MIFAFNININTFIPVTMNVNDYMLFGRWELAVADDIYIRNGKGTNIYPYRISI
jgi:hypothetical protein